MGMLSGWTEHTLAVSTLSNMAIWIAWLHTFSKWASQPFPIHVHGYKHQNYAQYAPRVVHVIFMWHFDLTDVASGRSTCTRVCLAFFLSNWGNMYSRVHTDGHVKKDFYVTTSHGMRIARIGEPAELCNFITLVMSACAPVVTAAWLMITSARLKWPHHG